MENYQTTLLVVALLVVAYIVYRRYEGFANEKQRLRVDFATGIVATPHELDMVAEDIVINPPYRNLDTRSIMASSGFVAAPLNAPWGISDDLMGKDSDLTYKYSITDPSCCSAQYPTPHKLRANPAVCSAVSKGELVPTSYFGNSSYTPAGCVCQTKEQAQFLYSRGGNA